MLELTKEYLDKQLNNQTKEIKSYVDEKVDGLTLAVDEKIGSLARMVADGLEEIKSELNVKKEVENLNKRMFRIEQALNIKN